MFTMKKKLTNRFACRRRIHDPFGLKVWVALLSSGLLLSLFLAPLVSSAHADSKGSLQLNETQTIHKAKKLICSDYASNADLEKGIAILTRDSSPATDEVEIPLLLAEANYRLADPSADINKEFPHYEKVGQYADQALEIDPHDARGHYWHGLYLLKKAQKVSRIRAYFIAKDGIKELESVRRALPEYDHGGASRVLALLYYIAPGWTPFGDLDKSIQLAREATQIDPNYMLNRLYLANAYKKKGDKKEAMREYRLIKENSPNVSGQKGDFYREANRSLASLQDS